MSTTIEPATSLGQPRRGGRPRRLHALDGLRTIAVLLVLAYHVKLPGMHGGFLGVDIFFVLSGFLITSLLAKEIAHRGRAHLGQFWMRRVLRLLPASLLVIGAVLIWAAFWAPPLERGEVGIDALWSLLYVANWRFIATSSYFADDGTTSPLQHIWSLAVEEQFYLMWPLLLAILAAPAVAHLRPRPGAPADSALRAERTVRRRRAVSAIACTTAVTLAGVSAVLLAWRYDPTAADRSYMGTDTKAFEPLLGAAAAALVLRPRVQGWVAQHAQPLILFGLASIVAGVALLGGQVAPQAAYFRGGAVAFALAIAVLCAATSLSDRRRGLPLLLGSTPVAYLGRISYGVYLWHWPLCVWIIGDRDFDAIAALAVLGLTVLAAAASYHLVEHPIRTGRLCTARPRLVLPQVAAVVGVVVLMTSQLGGSPLNTVVPAAAAAPLPSATQGSEPAAHTILVVGDSVMRRLAPQLAQTAADRGLVIASAARGGCSALDVVVVDGSGTP
ncbi:MAG: acyltransferase, partial [Micrococcales bacterium]|nr:acyltransferase [Micrococcales bacterium]